MKKAIAIIFLISTLFIGCGPASPPPPTIATVTPSKTLRPTQTSIPQTQEHLLVTRDREHWAVLNADGSLQKYIQIPGIPFTDSSDVSPDGNWLNYQSGSYEDEPYDLSLNLLNLDDGTSQFITNLLSSDFPENIEPVVESTFQYDQSLYRDDCTSLECRRSLVKENIAISAGISRWSPDGKFLAFAAQIDGPSTDLYIYSMQDKTIRRLTDDLQNVGRIVWSPDGKRILYANDVPGITNTTGHAFERTFHVINLEGRNFQISQQTLTKAPEWYMHGWVSNDLYLLQALYPEPGQWHFRQLVVANVENGQLTEIWPYPTSDVVIDTENQTIVLSFYQFFFEDPIPDAPEPGTYSISTMGDRKKISDQEFSFTSGSPQIIGTDDWIAYHILSDGSVKQIGPADGPYDNSSSPDKKWFFLDEGYDEKHNMVSLYNNAYQQIKSWVLDGELVDATWRTDSLGIFLFTSDNIYYLSIPDGEPQLLNVEVPPCQWDPVACTWPSFAWRP